MTQHSEEYAPSASPQTVVRDSAAYLAEAIAQHPALWEAMGQAWQRRYHDGPMGWAAGHAAFAVRCMCIVGGFDTCLVERKLTEDFG